MISFPIVDTHLHVWDPQKIRYPWLANVPLLNKPYRLADYNRACAPVTVERMVFVQCEADFAQYQAEADWVSELAQQEKRIQGIVPWAPLEKGDGARPALENLTRDPLVKGIRRIIQFETDVNFCRQPDFIKGVQLLADFDLHFEICIKGDQQFANTLHLIRQCPNTRCILNHIGKPFIKEHIVEPWRTHLKALAALPNTVCKMSGLVTEADFENWTPAELQPYVDAVLEAFGWDRVMFGGDWPVVLQGAKFPRWMETLENAVRGASPAQLKKLFHDNAVTFYRLP